MMLANLAACFSVGTDLLSRSGGVNVFDTHSCLMAAGSAMTCGTAARGALLRVL